MSMRNLTVILIVAGVVTVGAIASTQLSDQTGVAGSELIAGEIDAATFREIAQAQMPTVVSIRTVTDRLSVAMDLGGIDRFGQLFGLPGQMRPTPRILEGTGSGFIIDAGGLVLTNQHVVEGAREIEVTLFTDPQGDPDAIKRFTARVLGRDPLTDSALLQLSGATDLPVANLGDSDAMRPGDWVVAIGNPFALSHTVTVGVVSATSRPFPVEGRLQRVLQTDAAVNPGNSGGPLLNLRGEVVAVNTAILNAGTGANVGVGFAVPINLVRDLLGDLRKGDVQRGHLGVEIRSIPAGARADLGASDRGGVLVATVEPTGPAEHAGMRPGDVIVTFNGETIDDPDELGRLVANAVPGTVAAVGVIRNKATTSLQVTIGKLTWSDSGARAAERPNGLGLTLTTLNPDVARQRGLLPSTAVVSEVEPASPAAEAGVQAGDVILEVNRTAVNGLDDAAERLRNTPAGSIVFLLVYRNGQRVFLVIGKPR